MDEGGLDSCVKEGHSGEERFVDDESSNSERICIEMIC